MSDFELTTRLFKSPLGRIRTTIFSDHPKVTETNERSYERGHSKFYSTRAYEIEIIEFKLKELFYNDRPLADSTGWIFRIKKIGKEEESLTLRCVLGSPDKNTEYGPSSGECLDSVQVWDAVKGWQLNIGTEDGEMLSARAGSNDRMPARLKDKLSLANSFTEYIPFGFKTHVPELEEGERIYFHYLVAVDNYAEGNVSTWLAVDRAKASLEKWIGMTNSKPSIKN